MLKLIEIDPSFYKEEPTVSILDFSESKGLIKRAADERISQFASSITPDPKKIYVHILAMGAGEYFGANRNADYFPEENLLSYYKTFETTPAHIFKHHINKDPTIAIGQVVFAVYNERMHRVEVIAWIDREKGRDYVEKIERGDFPSTSMACHTPYDVCSICGNRARSRQEYCSHLTTELGRVYPDGRKVMAYNVAPLKFFDMSMVFRPADVTSSVLQKVASGNAIGSAEMAEAEGLQEKQATFKKLSELIKEVEGEVVASSPSLDKILDRVKDPDDEVLNFLVHYDMHHVLRAFAELGISPSVGFLAKLIGQKICGENVGGIENLVSALLEEEKDMEIPHMEDPDPMAPSKGAILSALTPFIKSASLYPDVVFQRMSDNGYFYAPNHGQGYSGNGPEPVESARDTYLRLKDTVKEQSQGHSLLRTLFTIGGAAIAAKWLLSAMIERKMKEVAAQGSQNSMPAVKIVLVKSASDAMAANELAKASLLRGLRGK